MKKSQIKRNDPSCYQLVRSVVQLTFTGFRLATKQTAMC